MLEDLEGAQVERDESGNLLFDIGPFKGAVLFNYKLKRPDLESAALTLYPTLVVTIRIAIA